MNKKMRFLPLLLAGLLITQPSVAVAATPYTFATAWGKALTGKMLSTPEAAIVEYSVVGSAFVVGSYLIIYAIRKTVKLHLDLIEGIQEHDNGLVSQRVVQVVRGSLSDYIWTALYNNNHEALKFLLEKGAKPDQAYTIWNGSALCVALLRNDFESAHLLLDHGANPLISNSRGCRPMFYAYKNEEVAQKMRSKVEERENKMANYYNKRYCKKPLVDPAQKKPSLIARLKNHYISALNHSISAFKRKKEAA